MGDYFFNKFGFRAQATNTGTNSGVSATQAAPGASIKLTCLGIQCSSDTAALVTIESPSGTVLWRQRFPAAFALVEEFPPGFINGAANAAMLVKVSASASNSEANIQTGQMTS